MGRSLAVPPLQGMWWRTPRLGEPGLGWGYVPNPSFQILNLKFKKNNFSLSLLTFSITFHVNVGGRAQWLWQDLRRAQARPGT